MRMPLPHRRALVAGFALLALFAFVHATRLGDAVWQRQCDKVRAALKPAPEDAWRHLYPPQGTIVDPTACTAATRAQFDMQGAPLMPPRDKTWYSCWPGYVESARGPRGSTRCENAYNGKQAPPQKFKHTGGHWYGCSFSLQEDSWKCPTCELQADTAWT